MPLWTLCVSIPYPVGCLDGGKAQSYSATLFMWLAFLKNETQHKLQLPNNDGMSRYKIFLWHSGLWSLSHLILLLFLQPGVLGYFEFSGSPQPPGYLTFFTSALHSLKKGKNNSYPDIGTCNKCVYIEIFFYICYPYDYIFKFPDSFSLYLYKIHCFVFYWQTKYYAISNTV